MSKWKRRALAAALTLTAALGLGGVWLNRTLPETFQVAQGEELELCSLPWIQPLRFTDHQMATGAGQDSSQNTVLAVFGVLPVKTVREVETPRTQVVVCGTPFGIKMFAQGALVVGFSDVITGEGSCNPAKDAGLRMGDLILEADGEKVSSNEELSRAIGQAAGDSVELEYSRDGATHTTSLTAVLDSSVDRWRAGMWVRDSSAGIGTMSFYLPDSGIFAGLGHPISDNDTGQQVSLSSGTAARVSITGWEKGNPGLPGQLQGTFQSEDLGKLLKNGDTGVYGTLFQPQTGSFYPVANQQEVHTGQAQMYTTIEGEQPQLYTVEIEKVSLLGSDPYRNMVIKVTDSRLLDKTGGILQGMSGSPVIQDGMLVGVVTHVLVNDPTRGYGIFAQTMLETAENLEGTEMEG